MLNCFVIINILTYRNKYICVYKDGGRNAWIALTQNSKLRGAAAERISIVCRCELRAVSFRELTSGRFNSIRLRGHRRVRVRRYAPAGCACTHIHTYIYDRKSHIRWSANRRVVHRIDLLSEGNESTSRCIICRVTHAKVVAQLSNTRVRVCVRVYISVWEF